MKILICSDGMPAAESAVQLGGLFAGPLKAETTLLGIAEEHRDEQPLSEALEKEAQLLRAQNITLNIVLRTGEPVRQILDQTSKTLYELVVIGARQTGVSGHYWRSERTYEVIKAIQPPVLVAIGQCKDLRRFLVCTGGKEFMDKQYSSQGDWLRQLGLL